MGKYKFLDEFINSLNKPKKPITVTYPYKDGLVVDLSYTENKVTIVTSHDSVAQSLFMFLDQVLTGKLKKKDIDGL